jgi:adenine-specific DNA methylase
LSSPARRKRLPPALREQIPVGIETRVLRRAGFRRWSDLFPARQLTVLLRAAEVSRVLQVDEKVKRRVQLAVAGAGEMAGFLCRWDRFHPKAFEALANHRFSALGVAVETNPLSKLGRGTILKRLAASLRAAEWARERNAPAARLVLGTESCKIPRQRGAVVVTGSSASQALPNRAARLVITDPPYYDAVQYRELSRLFLIWARVVTCRAALWKTRARQEAVPNRVRRSGARQYERLLRQIFAETARTLRVDGRMLLTYHSTDFRGWTALGRALHAAGFQIAALGLAHSENEKDHAKRGRLGFTKDLVLECRKQRRRRPPLAIAVRPRSSDQRELIAAGKAIARTKDGDVRAMTEAFLSAASRLSRRRIRIPQELMAE